MLTTLLIKYIHPSTLCNAQAGNMQRNHFQLWCRRLARLTRARGALKAAARLHDRWVAH